MSTTFTWLIEHRDSQGFAPLYFEKLEFKHNTIRQVWIYIPVAAMRFDSQMEAESYRSIYLNRLDRVVEHGFMDSVGDGPGEEDGSWAEGWEKRVNG